MSDGTKRAMNAHEKTVLTIVSFVAMVAIMYKFPVVALWAYAAVWTMLAIAALVCVYGCIYLMYDKVEVGPEPEQPIIYDY